MFKTQDLHVRAITRLSSPRAVKELFPAMPEAISTVVQSRERIIRILRQEDPRLLVVVGPCSIHEERSALEYARHLNKLRQELGDRLEIVMRVYFEKPRTNYDADSIRDAAAALEKCGLPGRRCDLPHV